MVVKLLSVVSEWEREAIAERTRDALSAKRRRGHVYGRIPYGSRLSADGVTLEGDPEEQRMIARLFALRTAGEAWKAIAGLVFAAIAGLKKLFGGASREEPAASIQPPPVP